VRRAQGRVVRSAGFGLVELLIAAGIAAVVLIAGWGWCWTATRSCARGADKCDARSTVAFVERLTTAELRSAVCLVQAPGVACTQDGIAFAVPSGDGLTVDIVTYVWDRGRGVLWRKAPGSHLAEGVAAFSITYYAAGDRRLPLQADGTLAPVDARVVRRVAMITEVTCGGASARASWQACLRGDT
jgi:hypothetical protein